MTVELSPLPDDLSEHFFEAGDVTLHYAIGGENGPPMVLIHGLGGMLQDFLTISEHLADRWRPLLIDLRGHGKSSHTKTAYNFDSYYPDIIALLRALFDSPVVVWGHSLGAVTTMKIAAEAPDLVSAAILEDPPMMIAGDPSHSVFIERFREMQRLMLSDLTDDELLAELRVMSPGFSEPFYFSRLARLRCNDPAIYTPPISGRQHELWDAEETLARIRCPVLLMQADSGVGAAVLDEHAERAMSILQNARHIKYEGVNHSIHAQLPDQTSADVESFLSDMGLTPI